MGYALHRPSGPPDDASAAAEDREFAEMPMLEDPCLEWIRTHPMQLARHVGHYVLIHADRGIVAVSEAPETLEVVGKSLGDPQAELLVHYVRPGMHEPAAP